MTKNNHLHTAKTRRKDEFYTLYPTIELEMLHYTRHFKNATVYCNCDNPQHSNFWKYFANNFESLGLKKLMSTYFCEDGFSMYTEMTANGVRAFELQGDGDFRSPECMSLLQDADIVVTNPPFSLLREFMGTLFEAQKSFVILGTINTLTTKALIPRVLERELLLGYSVHGGGVFFRVPSDYPLETDDAYEDEEGTKYIRVSAIRWLTNLDCGYTPPKLALTRRYDATLYPTYNNYPAINVDKVVDIPLDYDGIMGVPLTFLDKHNPTQFEIVGLGVGNDNKALNYTDSDGNTKIPYKRVLIKRKEVISHVEGK